MEKKYNPPPPDISLKPKPSPAPPPKKKVIEIKHTYDDSIILSKYLNHLTSLTIFEDKLQLILNEVIEIKRLLLKR